LQFPFLLDAIDLKLLTVSRPTTNQFYRYHHYTCMKK
jgi:hypothetical protein